jgi:hypothetical protein
VTGFTLRSQITSVEVIAIGRKLRLRSKLRRLYGKGRWRKLKGRAIVELPDGAVVEAELHWYEAHGIGRVGMKIKRLLT